MDHQRDDVRRTPRGSRGHVGGHGMRHTSSAAIVGGEAAFAIAIVVFFVKAVHELVVAIRAQRRAKKASR